MDGSLQQKSLDDKTNCKFLVDNSFAFYNNLINAKALYQETPLSFKQVGRQPATERVPSD
jgi:hypothetical protein